VAARFGIRKFDHDTPRNARRDSTLPPGLRPMRRSSCGPQYTLVVASCALAFCRVGRKKSLGDRIADGFGNLHGRGTCLVIQRNF
jgi:hypothetical protein